MYCLLIMPCPTWNNSVSIYYHLDMHTYKAMGVYIYMHALDAYTCIYMYMSLWKINHSQTITCAMQNIKNKYFDLKKLMRLPPKLELLAVFSRKLGHESMSDQCNNICPYSTYEHTVSLRHGHTDTNRLCIHFPFFESFLIYSCAKQSG